MTPNFPASSELSEFYRLFPRISVGVHLNPVVGKPLLPARAVPSLVNRDGFFWRGEFPRRLLSGFIRESELFAELLAQIDALRAMGVAPTHVDSHQNLHLLPRFFSVFLDVARERNIRRMRSHRHAVCVKRKQNGAELIAFYAARPRTAAVHAYTRFLMALAKRRGMKMADRLLSPSSSKHSKSHLDFWRTALSNMPGGVSEVYCHPAFVDDSLKQWATYVDPRRTETSLLLSREFSTLLKKSSARLMSFHDL